MTDAPERIWVDDERPQGGGVYVYDDLPELAKQFAVEYIRADLVEALKTEVKNTLKESS